MSVDSVKTRHTHKKCAIIDGGSNDPFSRYA
jgi:hypothetical protein